MNKAIQYFITFAVLLTILNSCIKDDVIINSEELRKLNRPLNFEGPLLNASFNATDLFTRMSDSITDVITIEDDGLICVKYKDSMITKWDEILDINVIDKTVEIALNNSKSTDANNIEERIILNETSDQRFDSLYVSSAVMTMNISFPNNYSGNLTIEFPEITKDGQSLSFNFDASETIGNESKDLEGYTIIFSHGTDSSYITMKMTPDIQPTGTPLATDVIKVTMLMPSLVPEIMFGYFGQKRVMDQEQTMSFHFFEDLDFVDNVEFFDIQMEVGFDNYYGIPYNCEVVDVKVIQESTNEMIDLESDHNSGYVDAVEYKEEIEPTSFYLLYTKENSNIGDVVNMFPDRVDYHLQVDINPNGEDGINFVTEANYIAGKLYLTIPMWLKTQNYHRYDTAHNFNLVKDRETEQLEAVEIAELYFTFHNGFPFEVDAQVFVADEDYNIVDSLFSDEQRLLATGLLDDNDKVIEKSITQVTAVLTSEQLVDYKNKNVSRLILRTKTSTAYEGEQFVKIFDTYGIQFELNAKILSGEVNF